MLLKVVSSLTHASNVNSKRGLQRVLQVCEQYVQFGRENSLEKRNYFAALHLKKKTANKLYLKYLILSEKIFQQLNLEQYRQKLLAGTEKENSQIFNKDDFYLPLYTFLHAALSQTRNSEFKHEHRLISIARGRKPTHPPIRAHHGWSSENCWWSIGCSGCDNLDKAGVLIIYKYILMLQILQLVSHDDFILSLSKSTLSQKDFRKLCNVEKVPTIKINFPFLYSDI
jgi:hypothetical protein